MSDLDSETRALLERSAQQARPTSSQRTRVRRVLLRKLPAIVASLPGAAAAASSSGAGATAGSATASIATWKLVVIGATMAGTVAGGGWLWAAGDEQPQEPPTGFETPPEPSRATPGAPSPVADARGDAATAMAEIDAGPTVASPAPSASEQIEERPTKGGARLAPEPAVEVSADPTTDRASNGEASTGEPTDDVLAEDVQLLRNALAELRAGQAAEALSLLGDHAERFPQSPLATEREEARRRARAELERADGGPP